MKKLKNPKHKKPKDNPAKNSKDFLIIKNHIYYANTISQRAKLKKFQNISLGRQQHENHSRVTKQNNQKKPSLNNQIIKDNHPKKEKTIIQQIYHLSISDKKKMYYELRKEIKIKKIEPNIQYLDQQLQQIAQNIHTKHSINIILLSKLRDSNKIKLSQFQQKFDIINKIVERKLKLIENIKQLFQAILIKQRQLDNNDGEINLSQLIYSISSISCLSSQKIISQKQIQEDRNKLITLFNEKLNLKFSEEQSKKQISIQNNEIDDLICDEKTPNNKKEIIIPPIMTRERREQIEKEKKFEYQKKAQIQFQKRIGIQLGSMILENQKGIQTNLISISNYLDGLIKYLLKNYQADIIELINTPYGKSALDRIAQITGRNTQPNYLPFILDQKLFEQYQNYIYGKMKITDPQFKNKQYQQIHHRILFDCLNEALNIYRPYFSFKGEVFPWMISQKGLTFYSITNQNIEQVFQKSKITILEKASNLCGVLPQQQLNNEMKQIYETKRQELLKKTINSQVEQDNQWKSFQQEQALIRIELSNWVFNTLVQDLIKILALFK